MIAPMLKLLVEEFGIETVKKALESIEAEKSRRIWTNGTRTVSISWTLQDKCIDAQNDGERLLCIKELKAIFDAKYAPQQTLKDARDLCLAINRNDQSVWKMK
jgi:hypothetical protein